MSLQSRLGAANQSVRGRVALGLGANMMGKFWVIATQLVCVPVLTWKWGANGYGVWLMLTTVPSYVALTSFGFGNAAAVDMTQKFARGDRDGALNALQSVWVLITAVLAGVLLVALALFAVHDALFSGLRRHAHFEDIAKSALALVVYAIAVVQMSTISIGYQCSRRYALGTILLDAVMPAETVGVIAACVLGGGVVAAALSMTAIRVAGALVYYASLRRFEPWVRLGWSHASIAEIRRLSRPALASLSMTLSTALSLQGTVLALGFTATPAAAAVFATARLLTRTPLQFIGLVNRATLPEMTAAYAHRDVPLSARLILLNLAATALVAVPSALLCAYAGPWLLVLLSKGRLNASAMLFVWLAAVATLQGAWNTVGQFLYSMNRQQTFSHYYLLVGGLVAAAPFLVGRADQAERVAMTWCFAEALMLAIVWRAWDRETIVDGAALRTTTFESLGRLHRKAVANRG